MRYFNPQQLISAARNAMKPALLVTMGCTLIGAVVIYGMFSAIGAGSGNDIVWRFIGGAACLLWTLFGLTALARQLHLDMQGEPMPNTKRAMCFAWSRIRSLVLLPAWIVGGLLALLVAELVALYLSRIPGLGLVWLALIGVPLVLLNTLVALGLLLALFNIAARVAMTDADAHTLRNTLWRLLRKRFSVLTAYNLGGVLATAVVASIVLWPVDLGLQLTWGLAQAVAGPQVAAVANASGFWGGVAHLVALVLAGALLAAVAGVPGIVITHMTLLVHRELDTEEAQEAQAATESRPQAPEPQTRAEPQNEASGPQAEPDETQTAKAQTQNASSDKSASRKSGGTHRRKTSASAAKKGSEAAADKTADDEGGEKTA